MNTASSLESLWQGEDAGVVMHAALGSSPSDAILEHGRLIHHVPLPSHRPHWLAILGNLQYPILSVAYHIRSALFREGRGSCLAGEINAFVDTSVYVQAAIIIVKPNV